MDDVDSLINTMRMVDRPFHKKTYDDALPKSNPFGYYMRMLGSPQLKNKTYLESEFEGHFEEMIAKSSKELNKKKNVEDVIKFKIDADAILRWGSGYDERELYQLETFYDDMITANVVTTPQHKEYLKLICKLNLEQNKALSAGEVTAFKNLNTQYNTMIKDSGFRPIDKKSSDESIGIRTFSQIFEEVEKDGFVKPYPYQEDQDIVDKTIMYLGNYTRKLVNMQSMSEPPEDTPKIDGSDSK